MAWELEFYEDKDGREPVKDWLDGLEPVKKAAALRGLSVILGNEGPSVLGTEYGKPLGKGLFEFRLRIDAATVLAKHHPGLLEKYPDQPRGPVVLRVFCHASEGKLILLLGAYDKGIDPSKKRQDREIAVARSRLNDWARTKKGGSRFRRWWISQVRR